MVNVVNVWNVGVVYEFGGKKCIVVVPMGSGRFRVALPLGWAVWTLCRLFDVFLNLVLSNFGLTLECVCISVGLIVCG